MSSSTATRHGSGQSIGPSAFRRQVTAVWKRTIREAGRGLQVLWRLKLGWLAGHHFAVVTHVGRRTGRPYRTVLWVYRYEPQTRAVTVISVWGETQWIRNLRNQPAKLVEIARQRYVPEQQFLSSAEVLELEKRFRREHPVIARGQAKLMAWPWPGTDDELQDMSSRMRAVTFRPSSG